PRSNAAQAKKRRNPSGGSNLERLAALLSRYRSTMDMRLARALPSAPTCFRAGHPSISTVSERGDRERGDNYAPEQIESCPRVRFVRSREETRYHRFLCVLP